MKDRLSNLIKATRALKPATLRWGPHHF